MINLIPSLLWKAYAYVINKALAYLDNVEDIGEFDIKAYIAKNKEELFYEALGNVEIPTVLKSQEQKRYLFQQYQLQQAHSHRSARKSVSSQKPHFTRTEQYMKKQGYGRKYIAGLDHANASLKLAQSLRERPIDPVNTHIPEFAELIDVHIAFIREGINGSKKLSDSEKAKKIELLDLLQSKAQFYKDSEKVTYLWWLNFNLHLSIIATPNFDLLDYNNSFYSYLFKEVHQNTANSDDMDDNSFKEWIVNEDGSHLLKVASLVDVHKKLRESLVRGDDHGSILMNIINNLGLGLTLEEMKALHLKLESEVFLTGELVRQMHFEPELNDTKLNINAFYASNKFFHFIELFHQFPERIMLPTIHDLGFMSINKTYGNGVHLVGLEKDMTRADGQPMSPFKFFMHDISHASSRNIDDPQSFNQFQDNLESLSLSKIVREFIEKLYFELAHEAGVRVLNARNYHNGHRGQMIEEIVNEKEAVLIKLTQKLGGLKKSEKLELQRTVLMLTYLKIPEEYIIFDEEPLKDKGIEIEFTEENINDPAIFARLILSL